MLFRKIYAKQKLKKARRSRADKITFINITNFFRKGSFLEFKKLHYTKKMGTNSIIGYSAAGVGLVIIAFSNQLAKMLTFLGTKSLIYTIMAGIVLIAGGIAFVMTDSGFSKSGKVKHATEEVPIYEGEGKKRRIVGYKKVKD